MRENRLYLLGKKSFCALIVFAIVLFNVSNNQIVASAKKENAQFSYKSGISQNDAVKIARSHLNSVLLQGDNDGKWNKKTKISNNLSLYDVDGKICAYAIQLANESEDAGYIVVGSNEEYTPIIEYATSGTFLKESLQETEYIIYDGTLDYYKTTDTSDIMSNIHKSEKKKKAATTQERETHTEEWKSMVSMVSLSGSNPPDYGVEITNPGIYESGYTSIQNKRVPAYNAIRYFKTNSFESTGKYGCLPTAVTNLLYYWHERKIYNLMNGSWNNTFSLIYDYLGVNANGEGAINNVPSALDRYLNEMGVRKEIVHHYGPEETTWERMKTRIDEGEPFIYKVVEHPFYKGTHDVLALGYENYKYSDGTNSAYLCVADGWIDSPQRFIHTEVGALTAYSEMATLHFIGK